MHYIAKSVDSWPQPHCEQLWDELEPPHLTSEPDLTNALRNKTNLNGAQIFGHVLHVLKCKKVLESYNQMNSFTSFKRRPFLLWVHEYTVHVCCTSIFTKCLCCVGACFADHGAPSGDHASADAADPSAASPKPTTAPAAVTATTGSDVAAGLYSHQSKQEQFKTVLCH